MSRRFTRMRRLTLAAAVIAGGALLTACGTAPATSNEVIGFSIPNFTEWHKTHADEDGFFDIQLPAFWDGAIDQQ